LDIILLLLNFEYDLGSDREESMAGPSVCAESKLVTEKTMRKSVRAVVIPIEVPPESGGIYAERI
jgi:hypothetical protein